MSLSLHLYSFGYRFSGIPQAPTEHGGGFVFDCRMLPNPGLEEHYRQYTGLDPIIQQYFQERPIVQQFFENCHQLIQSAVQSYQEKGYTDLMVSFGCTGGQHRSVYLSEQLKATLSQNPALQVSLTHTEQGHWP